MILRKRRNMEIERKFLVKGDYKSSAVKKYRIVQGYLSSHPERNVRIRIKDIRGYITIKGIGNESGITRFEWEKEILLNEAKQLLELCEPGIIEKIRYLIPAGNHNFEVDEFRGENEGLVLAEIELNDEEEPFIKPPWLGKEVTGDKRYYNAMLLKNPYTKW